MFTHQFTEVDKELLYFFINKMLTVSRWYRTEIAALCNIVSNNHKECIIVTRRPRLQASHDRLILHSTSIWNKCVNLKSNNYKQASVLYSPPRSPIGLCSDYQTPLGLRSDFSESAWTTRNPSRFREDSEQIPSRFRVVRADSDRSLVVRAESDRTTWILSRF